MSDVPRDQRTQKLRRLRALVRPWPRLVAEAVGLASPEAPRAASGRVPTEQEWGEIDFGAFWYGHASVMLRLPSQGGESRTIYADPNFREHAGFTLMGAKIGRRRSTALPDELGNTPHPDVVLLSHAHFDHWDRDAMRLLSGISDRETVAVIPTGTRKLLPPGFDRVVELAWGQAETVQGLAIRAVEPRHWGARAVWDRHRGYNAYVMEGGDKRVVFAGDTAQTDAFDHIADEGGVDLAVLPIGNYYEPWENQHCTPEQAADMAGRMGARAVLAMHHATFRDPVEPIDEPLERFLDACAGSRVICRRVGELWSGGTSGNID